MFQSATQDLARVVIFFVSYVLTVVQLVLQAACADLPRGYAPGVSFAGCGGWEEDGVGGVEVGLNFAIFV